MSNLTRRAALRLCAAMLAGIARPASAQERVHWSDIVLLDGRTLTAAELNRSTVVVQMWASWCPFCARQNPHVQRLHEQSVGKLIVLALSIGKDPGAEHKYLRQRGYTFAAAMAPARTAEWFGKRRSLPEVYVVQPGGHVVLREEGEMFAEDIQALMRFAK